MEIKKIKTLGNIEYFATSDGDILRKLKHKTEKKTKRERVEIEGTNYTVIRQFKRGKESHADNHYLAVDLSGRGTCSVHRLIAEAFYGDIGENVVNHKNGIKNDNRVENLEIVTPQYNLEHAQKTGLRKKIDHNYIKELLSGTTMSQKEIAAKTGCSVSSVEKIKANGKIRRPKSYSVGRKMVESRSKLVGSKWHKDVQEKS